jgi:hypothetical protein
MTPEQARAVKPYLRMAVVVQSQAHISQWQNYDAPTLDFPSEISTTGYYLDVTVQVAI